jgi:hypothetical protein
LIYFIPGNPGLIQYYYDFLTHLASLLDPDVTNFVYHVVGHSLGGFELQQNVAGALQLEGVMTGPDPKDRTGSFRNWGLNRQQGFVFESLRKTVELVQRIEVKNAEDQQEAKPLLVMMVGHSVGAYLMMQDLAWRHKTQIKRQTGEGISKIDVLERLRWDERLDEVRDNVDENFEIVGGVGLFPTIVDLAGSPKGRMLAVRILLPFCLSFVGNEFGTDAAVVASGQAMVVRNCHAISCIHPPTYTQNLRPNPGQASHSPASKSSQGHGCVLAKQIQSLPSFVRCLLELPPKSALKLICEV